jgi:hypothetical protein
MQNSNIYPKLPVRYTSMDLIEVAIFGICHNALLDRDIGCAAPDEKINTFKGHCTGDFNN